MNSIEQSRRSEDLSQTLAKIPTQELLERIAAESFREQVEPLRIQCPACRASLSLQTCEADPLEERFGRIDPHMLEAEMRSRLSQVVSP